MTTAEEVIAELRRRGRAADRASKARFAINVERALGVSVPELRRMARPLKRRHDLACGLWASGIHEARLLASFIDDPDAVSAAELDARAGDLDSWDVTDGFAGDLVARTPHAWAKVEPWAEDEREFVRRAGFALLAQLAVHDKAADDDAFIARLPLIRAHADDERNFVKKAVNWALRQIGKRNATLNALAVAEAEAMIAATSRAARWIGRDARRELTSEKVRSRL